jgi:hypothetical protein
MINIFALVNKYIKKYDGTGNGIIKNAPINANGGDKHVEVAFQLAKGRKGDSR